MLELPRCRRSGRTTKAFNCRAARFCSAANVRGVSHIVWRDGTSPYNEWHGVLCVLNAVGIDYWPDSQSPLFTCAGPSVTVFSRSIDHTARRINRKTAPFVNTNRNPENPLVLQFRIFHWNTTHSSIMRLIFLFFWPSVDIFQREFKNWDIQN